MKYHYILPILCFCTILISSCRSSKQLTIYSYEPTTGQISQQNERKISSICQDSITMIIALDHYNAHEMTFDVSLKNGSKRDLPISYDMFYLKPANATTDMRCYALDPFAELEKISKEKPSPFINKLLSNAISCCLTNLMNAICAEVCGVKQTDEEINNNIKQEMSNNRKLETERFLRQKNDRLALWQNFALKTKVIHPDQQVSGKIYFVFDVGLPAYDVYLSVGNRPFCTTFNRYALSQSPINGN